MTIKEMVQNFYNDAEQKNDGWQKNLSEDVLFADADKKTQSEGKEAFIKLFNNALRFFKSIKVKQMIEEGHNVCTIISYVYVNTKGETMNQEVAEIWKVKESKLTSLIIYLDLSALWKFLGR